MWIAQGYALFRKSPALWLGLLALLFLAGNLFMRVPVLGIVFVLLMPLFLVGFMEGCSALERGRPLELSHLAAGFRRNAAPLVTIGGLTLMGNLLVTMLVIAMGGDPLQAMFRAVSEGRTPSPELQAEAGDAIHRALFVGIAASVPLLMALWFAPLLVHFDGLGPIAAMRASLLACLKNAGPLLVYGGAIMIGMMVILFVLLIARGAGLALAPYDLVLWLLTPIVLPSVYVSYKDVFRSGAAPDASEEPPPPA